MSNCFIWPIGWILSGATTCDLVDLGAMAMKGYSAFPKAPASQEPHHQMEFIGYWLIGLVGRAFTNSPGDQGSIQGCVISKTLKMVLDTSLLNTQQYKVRIKSKVVQSWERSSAISYTSV